MVESVKLIDITNAFSKVRPEYSEGALKSLTTTNGASVNYVSDGIYELVDSGLIVRERQE